MRLQGRPVILVGARPMADAKARLLERAGAILVGEEAQASLAVVAADDEAAVARLKARGILVNAVDRPDLCDFTLPAIIDRDPVLIAIGTGGASAGLAAALRQRLETLLPAGLGRLAEALFGARERLRHRFPAIDERRRAIGALLAAGGPLDPLVEHMDPAAAIASAERRGDRCEQVVVVSGDPEALTLRAARLLGLADHVYHDRQVPNAILDRARADAERVVGEPPAAPPPGLTLHLIWKPQ
ncbi:precorrin-2 dehydrogenase/sirohydrochlorin ferrochelatase family protein [Sphingomonas crusticola]|uniref:precorrin-2 dehydrogenase/sirohydrochlorin ferrochelatase family protein n=1 Tax=Sphingomonas crusticola TaxID=1697973 RepID=UPI001F08510E|nr:NAD(P)-dependent oxidoreductase [Sphingomonas crusticola]